MQESEMEERAFFQSRNPENCNQLNLTNKEVGELFGQSLLELKDLYFENAEKIAFEMQTIKNSEYMIREFNVNIRLNNQQISFNMEKPQQYEMLVDENYQQNQGLFFLNNNKMNIQIREKYFRLERDDDLFIKNLKQNLNSKSQLSQFLSNTTSQDATSKLTQNVLQKKNKVAVENSIIEPIFDGVVDITQIINVAIEGNQSFQEFSINLSSQIILKGKARILFNEFTKMPRGQISVAIKEASCFKNYNDEDFKDLVFLFKKQVNSFYDHLIYRKDEKELKNQESEDIFTFETYHFDDYIQIEVYQKGSLQKNQQIAESVIFLREINFKQSDSSSKQYITLPVEFLPFDLSMDQDKIIGTMQLQFQYNPRPLSQFYVDWKNTIYNISSSTIDIIDKYEHFNDFLSNEFTVTCQYGVLELDLNSVYIPANINQDKNKSDDQNLIFMLKIRIRNETKVMFIGSPDQIFGDHRKSIQINAQVQSLRDVVQIELFDVLNEDSFDPKVVQPIENLRLLSLKTFEVKDLPFDDNNKVNNYLVLLPISTCNKVVQLQFQCHFQRSVPIKFVAKSIEDNIDNGGYMLLVKTIFKKQFVKNHDKKLDKTFFQCKIINLTKLQNTNKSQLQYLSQADGKIFFNKEIFIIGEIFVQIGDMVEIQFYENNKECIEKNQFFANYQFVIKKEGFSRTQGLCEDLLSGISTWQSFSTVLDINYIADNTNGQSSISYNKRQARLRDQKKEKQQDKPEDRQGPILNSLKTIQKRNDTPYESNILVNSIELEFELRRSDLIDSIAQDSIQNCICEVQFDEDNIHFLQEHGDFEIESKLKMEVISKDKNAFKTRIKEKEITRFLSKTIPQQLFRIDDTIQIQILNQFSESHFVLINPIELPLQFDQSYDLYSQIGTTSQLYTKITLRQNQKLLKLSQTKESFAGDQTKSYKSKLEEENDKIIAEIENQYNKTIKMTKDKSIGMAERIIQLKSIIHYQKQANKELFSKQNKLKKEYDKAINLTQQAQQFSIDPVKSMPKKEISVYSEFSKGAISKNNQTTNQQAKAQQLNICACGQQDPKYKGYCEDCANKLRKKYDYLIDKYTQLKKELDQYSQKDVAKKEEKMELLKNKMLQYGAMDANLMDIISLHSNLFNSEDNKAIAEIKVNVQALNQEIEIIKIKKEMDLESFKQRTTYLEQQLNKKQVQFEKLKKELDALISSDHDIQSNQEYLEKILILKKRLIFQMGIKDEL